MLKYPPSIRILCCASLDLVGCCCGCSQALCTHKKNGRQIDLGIQAGSAVHTLAQTLCELQNLEVNSKIEQTLNLYAMIYQIFRYILPLSSKLLSINAQFLSYTQQEPSKLVTLWLPSQLEHYEMNLKFVITLIGKVVKHFAISTSTEHNLQNLT